MHYITFALFLVIATHSNFCLTFPQGGMSSGSGLGQGMQQMGGGQGLNLGLGVGLGLRSGINGIQNHPHATGSESVNTKAHGGAPGCNGGGRRGPPPPQSTAATTTTTAATG